MKKTIACLLVLAYSCLGCTTMTTVGGIRGFRSPTQGEGAQLGVRIQGGSGVDKEVVSVDRATDLPIQSSFEPSISDELPIPETLAIALIISFIVRDIVRSITISIRMII